MSGLRDLAAQATPGPWELTGPERDLGQDWWHVYAGEGSLEATYLRLGDARLIALAPELAVRGSDLADAARGVIETWKAYPKEPVHLGDILALESALARFAALNTKADTE